ncbi:MAG: toll/interleukin-1 receptor domain-containing protein, partial [Proteobacteria bacterium]|nr:toll/interleukin-1 receptor domain-containing protein [Pseudomonadota bacterium]
MPANPPDEIDFFISYTGKDRLWAEWIAWQLEHHGYHTLIQAWDFKSGSVFPGDMHRALLKSKRVIAVLTPDYMQSGFCQPEWQAAFTDDPTGVKGILVGVRVADFKPDGILKGRTYIDLVGLSESEVNTQLLARLENGRAKPATPPAFPGSKKTAAPAFPGSGTGSPVSPPEKPPIPSNLPGGYISRLFLGREEFLEQLRTALTRRNHATAITQAVPVATGIAGLGGIGKTHAAVVYADRHRGDYCALLFVSGDSPEKLRASLAALCSVLQLDAAGALPPDESVRVAAAVDWLASHHDWLLIVDNVDTEEAAAALTALLEHLTTGHVLITSRLHDWADHVESLDLDVLHPDAATDLLLKLTEKQRRKANDDPAQARRLAELMEGLPLALHQAAGYIREQRLTLAGYLATYEREAAELLGWFKQHLIPYAGPESIGPRPVLITWKTSFDKLDADTRFWLLVFAHFAADPIPEFLLDDAPDATDEVKIRHRTAKK